MLCTGATTIAAPPIASRNGSNTLDTLELIITDTPGAHAPSGAAVMSGRTAANHRSDADMRRGSLP